MMRSPFPDGELDEAAEIGAVTDRSVRLWVRAPTRATLRVELEVAGREPVTATVALGAATDWTGAVDLALPSPAPEQPFRCRALERQLTGRLAPAPETHTGFAFAFGSCNDPFALAADETIRLNRAAGIYPAMRDELRQAGARFVLLGGDQIYSDVLEPISVRHNLPGDDDHPPTFERALDAYRQITRGFLGEVGFRSLREAFPTYWMWDDHDIFNNWGSRLKESALDRCLFAAASQVYREYQQAHNPGGSPLAPPYGYHFRYGTAGFLVLDLRGARDYQVGRLLGATQWEAVRTYLTGPEAADLHTLFVVASVPIAHVSRWFVELFQHLPFSRGNDVRDRWCSASFVDSRDELLEALFGWQAAERYRQVIVLSGDVHAASVFTIRRHGGQAIQQWTSSAFTTQASWLQRTLNRIATYAPNLLEPRFRFRRLFFSLVNNFGLVQLTALPTGGHRAVLTVRGWDPAAGTVRTVGQVSSVPDG
jgi:alkaline phosphatase D